MSGPCRGTTLPTDRSAAAGPASPFEGSTPAASKQATASVITAPVAPAPATAAITAPVAADPWAALRRHTPARIALGRAGTSLPTAEALRFAAAHAQARDAVHVALDIAALTAALRADGWATVQVASRAPTRDVYLRRPDLGRRLDDESVAALQAASAVAGCASDAAGPGTGPGTGAADREGKGDDESKGERMGNVAGAVDCEGDGGAEGAGRRTGTGTGNGAAAAAAPASAPAPAAPVPVDVALVVGDGLSAIAVQRHAVPLLRALRDALAAGPAGAPVALSPRVVVATQARVALADEIGALLHAAVVLIAIGERPGLSSPDSVGLYLTHAPRVGRSDAERNCISNVRPEGLAFDVAAARAAWLLREALRRCVSGVALKDDSATMLVR